MLVELERGSRALKCRDATVIVIRLETFSLLK